MNESYGWTTIGKIFDRKVMKGLSSCGKNMWISLYLITVEDAQAWKGENFRNLTIFRKEEAALIAGAARTAEKRGLIAGDL